MKQLDQTKLEDSSYHAQYTPSDPSQIADEPT